MVIRGISRQRCPSASWANSECTRGGREAGLGEGRGRNAAPGGVGSHPAARAQLLAEAPLAGPGDDTARTARRPCCLAPSPTCPQLPAAAVPAPPATVSLPPGRTEPLLSFLLQAMAATQFFISLLQVLIQHMPLIEDELDEATRDHVRERVGQLSQAMTQLLQELEQRSQSGFAWRALLFAALPQWQFWATAGLLVLFLGLCCWWLRKRNRWVGEQRRRGELQQN